MQTRPLQEVLAYGGRDGTHIADVLHDGGNGYRHNGDDGRDEEGGVHIIKYSQHGLLTTERQTYPCSIV